MTIIIYPKVSYGLRQVQNEKYILGKIWKMEEDEMNYYLKPDLRLLKGGD